MMKTWLSMGKGMIELSGPFISQFADKKSNKSVEDEDGTFVGR